MEYPFEELQKRFLSLPDSLRQALSSTEITTEIQEIASNHNLMIDQEENLYQLIACVMLGIISIHDFKDKLIKDLKMQEGDAVAVINEIDTKIFAKFKQELFELTNKSDHESLKDEGIVITNSEPITTGHENAHPELPIVPSSITPKTINLAGNSFVNAFLTKPVSTTQTTTTVTVGGSATVSAGNLGQSAPMQQGLSPLSKPSSIEPPQNGTLNVVKKPIEAPKAYTVDPYKEPIN